MLCRWNEWLATGEPRGARAINEQQQRPLPQNRWPKRDIGVNFKQENGNYFGGGERKAHYVYVLYCIERF